ncbi:MAG TPA: hypothetical protein DCG53_05035 [Syntrophus sp. (in: bacteria)]|jgi:hypothetical protein|nr:hypothetical protein [Deltaproteobacteria bacterium]HAJ26599.1 hypothetical protein [Syntrophus sp. (in: bacteria)]
MTPEQIAALAAFSTIIERLGTAPTGSLIAFILLAPWIVLAAVSIYQNRRFEAVVQMYENNFTQTETCTKLAEGFAEMAKGFRELLVWTTKETTETKQAVMTNMHCPLIRKGASPKDIQ